MEKHVPSSAMPPRWTPAPVEAPPSRPISGEGGNSAMVFDPMVVGTARFGSDEERAAALWKALEESLDDDVIDDFDHKAFVRELNERWRRGEI